jgi:hypothetical protein
MIVRLAPEPRGKTGQTVGLNSSSRSTTTERLLGEQSQGIIDCIAIHINGGVFALSGNNGVTVSIADAGGLRRATYNLVDFAGASGLEAGDFQLESGGLIQEATSQSRTISYK